MQGTIEFITVVGAVTGFVSIFDLFSDRKFKGKVAEYIFGGHTIKFREFEQNVIRTIMSWFVVSEKLKLGRIFVYSFTCTFLVFFTISMVAMQSSFGQSFLKDISKIPFLPNNVNFALVVYSAYCSLILSICGFIFDFWSFFTTKKIFFDRTYDDFRLVTKWFLDVCISVAPAFFLFFVFVVATGLVEGVMFFLFVGQLFGMLAISLIQLILISIGSLVRLFILVSHLNLRLAMKSKVHDYPFTFVGVNFGFGTAIINAIY